MYIRSKKAMRLALLATASFAIAGTASAQESNQGTALGEVIVTARKRQESILNVPVVETAIAQQKLERLQTNDLKDIANLVPGLSFGESLLSIGTQVSLRGVGTSALDPGVDASVSLNLDGLQLSQGLAYMIGMFDVGQVEVLKGPQALFYGKSSPGGVISVRSADPTSRAEIIARAGYEFEAREKRAELIVSGPVSDTLKLRLASAYSDQDGFYKNVAVATGLGGRTTNKRIGPDKTYMLRGTVLWNPVRDFDARLKLNHVRDRTTLAGTAQFGLCPDGIGPVPGFGIQFMSPYDNCRLDRNEAIVAMDPAAFPGIINNGTPYLETTQDFGSLELNYRPRPDLTLTSTTGYYLLHSRSLFNTLTGASGPFLVVLNSFHRREVTEEVRLNSDFAGPLNFTLGGFLQRGKFTELTSLNANILFGAPAVLQKGIHNVDIDTNSVFGQLRYKLTPQLEIAAGARWTDEKRSDTPFSIDPVTNAYTYVPIAVPKIRSKTTSPELTLTYRPTDDLTFFGALKKGYKSGSFNVGTPALPDQHNAFGDEKVKGGEIGLKSRWLDRSLAFNLALYDYKYSGLQVGANTETANGLTETRTVNAGAAKVYGVEADMAYRPPSIPGLDLHGSLNWNHGKFNVLKDIPCYGGQTIAAGCNAVFSATANGGLGGFTAQDRSGIPLNRAPRWQANFGFDYATDVGRGMTVVIASNNQYSSSYLANLGLDFYQKSFLKADLSVTLQGRDDRWELALIGKNIGNEITSGNCANANNQNGLLGGQITGTTASGPAGIDEIDCFMDRGREVWVRITLRPLN
jgi:iron complex outermembrane receptor protein